jgi:hypothetical protein
VKVYKNVVVVFVIVFGVAILVGVLRLI